MNAQGGRADEVTATELNASPAGRATTTDTEPAVVARSSKDERDRWRQLCAAATGGPWEALDLNVEVNGQTVTGAEHGWWWVWRSDAKPYYGGVLETDQSFTVKGEDGRLYRVAGAVGEANIDSGLTAQAQADAQFIAAARQAVPALLADVEDLQAQVDQLTAKAAEHAAELQRVRETGERSFRLAVEKQDQLHVLEAALADVRVLCDKADREGRGRPFAARAAFSDKIRQAATPSRTAAKTRDTTAH